MDRSSSEENSASESHPVTETAPPPLQLKEVQEPVVGVILCDQCRHPIASVAEILPERDEHAWRQHVYGYELDLFTTDSNVWAYSATNPSKTRFDLIRVAPTVTLTSSASSCSSSLSAPMADNIGVAADVVSLTQLKGPYSAEHSFFTGYDWCFCLCAVCGNFLGWGFRRQQSSAVSTADAAVKGKTAAAEGRGGAGVSSGEGGIAVATEGSAASGEEREEEVASSGSDNGDGDDELMDDDDKEESGLDDTTGLPPPDFLGIIITRCTGVSDYPQSAYHTDLRRRKALRKQHSIIESLRRKMTSVVNQLDNRLFANRLYLAFQHHAMVELWRSSSRELTVSESPASSAGAEGGGAATRGQRRRRSSGNTEGTPQHEQGEASSSEHHEREEAEEETEESGEAAGGAPLSQVPAALVDLLSAATAALTLQELQRERHVNNGEAAAATATDEGEEEEQMEESRTSSSS